MVEQYNSSADKTISSLLKGVNYWRDKYDKLFNHLEKEYGSSWLLYHLQEIEDEERGV